MIDMTAREMAVATLTALPLYQLSTAGMELFHTNVLYWLAVHRPDESEPLWSALDLRPLRVEGQEPFIRREWRHMDLVFSAGLGQTALVVENKIGAIPTAEQLHRYWLDAGRHLPIQLLKYWTNASRNLSEPDGATHYVLLSLTLPTFALPEPWRSVTYRDLLPALHETAGRLSGDEAMLMSSYAEMVGHLDEVARLFDPAGMLHESVQLPPVERDALSDARLLSLVEKVRVGRFAELATRAIGDKLGEVIEVQSGLSNSSGINDWFIAGPAGRRFGWQIQGSQFRLAVLTGRYDPSLRENREGLVQDLYESFFDFSPPDHLRHTLSKYTGTKAWLGYEPNFVYRFAAIAQSTTWDYLLALAVWFSARTRVFVDRMR